MGTYMLNLTSNTTHTWMKWHAVGVSQILNALRSKVGQPIFILSDVI